MEPTHIVLQGRVPSKKNSKRRIQRGRHTFMVPSEAHEEWHTEQMIYLQKVWRGKERIQSVKEVQLLFFAPDKRKADLSNKAESVMDLLVDAGVLVDDNWFEVPYLPLKFGGLDKENPRVEITIL